VTGSQSLTHAARSFHTGCVAHVTHATCYWTPKPGGDVHGLQAELAIVTGPDARVVQQDYRPHAVGTYTVKVLGWTCTVIIQASGASATKCLKRILVPTSKTARVKSARVHEGSRRSPPRRHGSNG